MSMFKCAFKINYEGGSEFIIDNYIFSGDYLVANKDKVVHIIPLMDILTIEDIDVAVEGIL